MVSGLLLLFLFCFGVGFFCVVLFFVVFWFVFFSIGFGFLFDCFFNFFKFRGVLGYD